MRHQRVAPGHALLPAGAACLCLASGAFGQGTAKWVVRAETADGDDIIDTRSEDDINITLGLDLTPSPGGTLADGSTVIGFGSLIADVLGGWNWETGFVTWTMNPDLIFLTGDLTTKDDSTQELHNINAGQVPDFGPFSSADPLWIMTINWRTEDPKSRIVIAGIVPEDKSIQAYIQKPGASFPEPQTWSTPGGGISFVVNFVPPPGTGLVMVVASTLSFAHRRRRCG